MHKIIKQTDGKYCLFCHRSEQLVYLDLTKEEIIEAFIASYEEKIKEEVERVVDALKNRQKPYGSDDTISYPKALLLHKVHMDQYGDKTFNLACLEALEKVQKDDPAGWATVLKEHGHVTEATIAIGTRVKTTYMTNNNDHSWLPEVLILRKKNEIGVVNDRHSGHGTCYTVLHDDGTKAPYDPWELELL